MNTDENEEFKELIEEDMARFEEDGYFKRLGKMFAGLGRSRDSREYKEAVIELQRQVAPVLAVLVPLIIVVVLFVVTAMSDKVKKTVKVDIVTADGAAPYSLAPRSTTPPMTRGLPSIPVCEYCQ